MEENTRLVLICEGGAHTVEYFHRNKVYPAVIVMETSKFREMSPYLTKNDEILVVIKGLTDFTMAGIYSLLNDLEEARDRLHDVTIMSNVDLGKISTPYYLYSGDLFYGTVKKVMNGKIYEIDGNAESSSTPSKGLKLKKKEKASEHKKKEVNTPSINVVISRYKKYNKRDIKFTIYGTNEKEVQSMYEEDEIAKKVVNVNLFPNS